ncbi:DNA methyltransferase [Thiohalorhabdus denitrificans]|uniref:site-specific DNA-methyltransferase (adenine-specific) n=1 Tax=Thiohalorhabdus denitrificans TaxID=381306 RepID=A0A0P9C562_9GAMM|nr:class I SAM-dependent DNA methyltransferase [Thiohalorhabdus denitrificans]KPV39983.1 DNA methyltransferase [Thiohalorhabdus denitrificans]SCY10815.1 type I restriction enzyme M protein [Thiohalorhabdus denitrificans]
MAISTTIKSIQDIMRTDVGVDGDAQRIGQLVWMLFLKIYDDREQEWELLEDNYVSPIPERLRWRNWAADPEGMTGDELKKFVDDELFPGLQSLEARGEDLRPLVIRGVFEDAYNYMKSGQLMRQVINKLQEMDFNVSSERHELGDVYEQILKDLQSAGNAGEFYTPRAVTEFIVNRVDPKLEEQVMDPACGTGGFLTNTIEHKREHYVDTPQDWETLQGTIRGIEKKPLPHLLASTNLILHGIEVPSQIRHDNTLARPWTDWGPRDRVDAIVANPPFGGMEEAGIETNFPQAFRTRETADLFMALFIHLLKDGGRAGVVLPDGFLFGEGIKTRIKEKLLTECDLHTIVRLPNGVFNPYTNIKTNLLFFTKGRPTKEVWYYEHPYPEGYKNYSKTKPMRFAEFEREIAWWGTEADGFQAREETEYAWRVPVEEIQADNYNLDRKNPYAEEEADHDPEELLAKYERQQAEIQELRDQLKDILGDALGEQQQ